VLGCDLVGDLLPFIQVTHAGTFGRAVMDEHIGRRRRANPNPFVALTIFTVPVVAMARSSRIDRQTQLSCNSLQGAAVGNRRYGGCQAAGGRVDRTIMRQ
jgi:hypothetical protein